MFGLGTGGDLYTIDVSHTVEDVNNTVGYDATQISSGIGAQNVVGLAFVSPTQLDLSTGSGLDQYNLSTHALSVLGNYANNTQIAGLSFTPTGLLGMQYSPSPGGVDQIGAGSRSPRAARSRVLAKMPSFPWLWVNQVPSTCRTEATSSTLTVLALKVIMIWGTSMLVGT
jgi:hypothetical protein